MFHNSRSRKIPDFDRNDYFTLFQKIGFSRGFTTFLRLEPQDHGLNNNIIVRYEAYNEFYLVLYKRVMLNPNSCLFGLHSRGSIEVFRHYFIGKTYAFSSWCLDELSKIVLFHLGAPNTSY